MPGFKPHWPAQELLHTTVLIINDLQRGMQAYLRGPVGLDTGHLRELQAMLLV